MAGYKELVDERELIVTEHSIEGTKAFYKQSDGTSSLPKLADKWSTAYTTCLLNKMVFTPFFPDPSDRTKWMDKIVCTFSTESGAGGGSRKFDPDGRRFTLGGEILGVESPTGWKWGSDSAAVDQPLFFSNIMGTFTRQRLLESDQAKNTWIEKKLIHHAGTINHAGFEGFRTGSVLFSGASGNSQYDDQGRRTWLFDLEFTYRIIRDEQQEIVNSDWRYIWRKDNGTGQPKWDQPKDINNHYLYAVSDLEQLFR